MKINVLNVPNLYKKSFSTTLDRYKIMIRTIDIKKTIKSYLCSAFSVIICLVSLAFLTGQVRAQNFSGLEGKTLPETEQLETAVESLIGRLLTDEKIEGRINLVTVTEDTERRLVVQVIYSEFKQERKLWAQVAGGDKKRQKQIKGTPVTVPAGAGEISLTLDLDENLPEGTQLNSAYLRINIGKTNKNTASFVQSFILGKDWQIDIKPENVIVKITPLPIGSAANLHKQQPLPLPTKRIKFSTVKYKPLIMPTKGTRVTTVATPKATNLQVRLQTRRNYFIHADGGGRLLAKTKKTPANTRFTLVDINGGKLMSGDQLYLKTSNNKNYIVANSTTVSHTSATVPTQHKTFVIKKVTGSGAINYNDRISLSTYKGQYISARNGGGSGIVLKSGSATNNERFKLVRATTAETTMLLTRNIIAKSETTTTPVQFKGTITRQLIFADKFRYGVGKEIKDKAGKGPSNQPVHLLNEINVERNVSIESEDVLRIWPQVFQDQNPSSGIFYFVPWAYHLKWDSDNGYGMRMLYFAATEEGAEGQVDIELMLDTGIDNKEYELAKNLVEAYVNRHPGTNFTELRPIPLDKEPSVSLAGGLEHIFNIPPEKIIVNAFSDALGEIHVSLVTDWITKENIQLALFEDLGVNGTLTLTPAGGAAQSQLRPIKVVVADARTFGRVYWKRGEMWRNQTPYPIRLKYLHALSLQNNVPVIHSWDLSDSFVPPKAQVEWNAQHVPSWLDNSAKFMWLDYTVEKNCKECNQQVVSEITGGVAAVAAAKISYETITPLADTDAYKIYVRTRSKYIHPTSRDVGELGELTIDADETEYEVGPIYVLDSAADDEGQEVLFEYYLTVVMKDGTTHTATKWMPNNSLRVVIGSKQIKDALGFMPGQNQEEPQQ